MKTLRLDKTKAGFSLREVTKTDGKIKTKKIGELLEIEKNIWELNFPDCTEEQFKKIETLLCKKTPEAKLQSLSGLKAQKVSTPAFEPITYSAPKGPFLVLCEGQTEVNYLRGLLLQFGLSSLFCVQLAKHTQPELIIEEAVKEKYWQQMEKKDFPEVMAVFDRDCHPGFHDALELAARHGIKTFSSNPCIEVWFLSHFKDPRKLLSRRIKSFYQQFSKTRKVSEREFEIITVQKGELLYASDDCIELLKKELPGYQKNDIQICGRLKKNLANALKLNPQTPPDELGSDLGKFVQMLELIKASLEDQRSIKKEDHENPVKPNGEEANGIGVEESSPAPDPKEAKVRDENFSLLLINRIPELFESSERTKSLLKSWKKESFDESSLTKIKDFISSYCSFVYSRELALSKRYKKITQDPKTAQKTVLYQAGKIKEHLQELLLYARDLPIPEADKNALIRLLDQQKRLVTNTQTEKD